MNSETQAPMVTLKTSTRLHSAHAGNEYEIVDELKHSAGRHSIPYRARVIRISDSTDSPYQIEEEVLIKIPRLELMNQKGDRPWSDSETKDWLQKMVGKVDSELSIGKSLRDLRVAVVVQDKGILSKNNRVVAQNSPKFLDEATIPFSVQRFMNGLTLEALYSLIKPEAKTYYLFKSLSQSLTEGLRLIHLRGKVHADIHASNIFIHHPAYNEGTVISAQTVSTWIHDANILYIDFANSEEISNRTEIQGQGYAATGSYTCPENPVSVQGDIYSLGHLFYFIITGKTDYSPADPLQDLGLIPDKQPLKKAIKSHNQEIYEKNIGVVDVIARCLWTPASNGRYSRVDSIQSDLRMFDSCISSEGVFDPIEDFKEAAKTAESVMDESSIFPSILRYRLHQPTAELREWGDHKHVNLYGSHNDVITMYSYILAGMNEGDEYLTYSTPRFWNRESMGCEGRFFSANLLAARSGVTIRRIYIVHRRDLEADYFRKVLIYQAREMEEINQIQTTTRDLQTHGFYTGILEIGDKEWYDLYAYSGVADMQLGEQYIEKKELRAPQAMVLLRDFQYIVQGLFTGNPFMAKDEGPTKFNPKRETSEPRLVGLMLQKLEEAHLVPPMRSRYEKILNKTIELRTYLKDKGVDWEIP